MQRAFRCMNVQRHVTVNGHDITATNTKIDRSHLNNLTAHLLPSAHSPLRSGPSIAAATVFFNFGGHKTLRRSRKSGFNEALTMFHLIAASQLWMHVEQKNYVFQEEKHAA